MPEEYPAIAHWFIVCLNLNLRLNQFLSFSYLLLYFIYVFVNLKFEIMNILLNFETYQKNVLIEKKDITH